MSRRAFRIWGGAAVLVAALPTLAALFPFGHTTAVGFVSYSPLNRDALDALLAWQRYTGVGIPVLIAAAPLAARGRALRPVAICAALLLVLIAAAGVYLGVYSGFAQLVNGLNAMPGAAWGTPATYLLAGLVLVPVAVRGRARGRVQPVISEEP